ncbi:MAG: pyridoxal-phosphate dependent enzyme [Alphaproteobacteria bacterium]
MITLSELDTRIAGQARVPLAMLPTPLTEAPRLSQALEGPRVLLKRDDLTGLAFGGNKTRQLEFLLAEAAASSADVLLAGAGTQSNWCRQISAAARVLGLDCELVLATGVKGREVQGNLLLDHLLGANVRVVDIPSLEQLPEHVDARAAELRAAGRKPYVVGLFDMEVLARSAIGYIAAAVELQRQFDEQDVRPTRLYVSGANMTPAGLAAGFRALGSSIEVVVVPPILLSTDRATDIAAIAGRALAMLGLDDLRLAAADIRCEEGFVGPGYGVLTEAAREALALTARSEGVLLDPVYTAKAMACLIAHARTGELTGDDTVVFIHTGGTPALFAYADELVGGA